MADRQRQIHYFLGYGGGVAMRLRRDGDKILGGDQEGVVATQAAAVLASIGGASRGECREVNFADLLRVESAVTEAAGDFQPARSAARYTRGNWLENQLPAVTTVSSVVKGVMVSNGGRKVELDLVSFRLEGVTRAERGDVPSIAVIPGVEGFRIDGAPLKVKFAPREFLQVPELEAFQARCAAEAGFLAKYGTYLAGVGAACPAAAPPKRLPKGNLVVGTVVDSIKWNSKDHPGDVKWLGRNRLLIPGWGTLIVGELRMRRGAKQIAMLRAELGSPWGGELEICFGGENGAGWPP